MHLFENKTHFWPPPLAFSNSSCAQTASRSSILPQCALCRITARSNCCTSAACTGRSCACTASSSCARHAHKFVFCESFLYRLWRLSKKHICAFVKKYKFVRLSTQICAFVKKHKFLRLSKKHKFVRLSKNWNLKNYANG